MLAVVDFRYICPILTTRIIMLIMDHIFIASSSLQTYCFVDLGFFVISEMGMCMRVCVRVNATM